MLLIRLAIIASLVVAVALITGLVVSQHPPFLLLGALAALVIFTLSFLNTEAGLYILVFSMLLSPEIVVSGVGGGSALGRGVTIRLDDLLLVIIGFSWFAKTAFHKELGLFLRTPLNRPVFYYVIVCLLATGVGIIAGRVAPKTGFFFTLKYFEYFIVFFMVTNLLETTQQMKRLLFCMFLTCIIVCVVGMLQIPGGGRVSAPFEGETGEPNTFGGYLVFMGALAAGLLSTASDKNVRWFLIGVLLFIIPPFLYTESRSSYLAAIPAALVFGFLSNKKAIVIGLILAGLAVSPLLLPANVIERITYTYKQRYHPGQHVEIAGVRLDTSLSARLISWRKGLGGWTHHPILGHGVSGFAFMDAQFPRVLVETGILGLIAFFYILYSIFRLAFINLQRVSDPFNRGLIKGFLAGYVGLLFHAIGANTFIIVRIMEPFWFVVGMLAILPELEAAENQDATMAGLDTGGGRDRRPLSDRLPIPYGGRHLLP
ncbi:hypothetical protein D3OALGB2SA_4613 [Olavius algarvensis associated proteobacterium Delta 3]|nr:hypothetical protein D3OALGB2SA_4613 [Olavius algarvensis associated proteobacterium Delta 3]